MYDNSLISFLNLYKCKGELGIEIEMETNNYIPKPPLQNWRLESDGSLIGPGGEFVLKEPIDFNQVSVEVNKIKNFLKDRDIKIKDSIRAGVHVHLNMQENTLRDVFKLIACYYPLETVLTNYCGNNRQGNLFCLRSRDSLFQLDRIYEAILKNKFHLLRTNYLRYSSFNLQSLFKYGSVEFRALATQPDLNNIEEWCEIILKLRDYSLKVDKCWDNIENISGYGPNEWMFSIFGDKLYKKLEYPNMEFDIMEDARNCQMICDALNEKGV